MTRIRRPSSTFAWLKRLLARDVAGLRVTLLAALALIVATAAVAGLLLDAKSFGVGLLESVVSLVVAFIAAVLVFDRLAEQQSERRRMATWGPVRVATLTAIWDQTRRMTSPIVERSSVYGTYAVAYESSLELMDGVYEWIQAQAVPLDKDAEDGLERYEEQKADMALLHANVFREFVFVREVLTPRVLELANDPDLTELLIAVETAERRWSECVRIAGPGETQGNWYSFPANAWTVVGDFYAAAVEVASYVASIPDLPPPQGLEIVGVDVEGHDHHRWRTIPERS